MRPLAAIALALGLAGCGAPHLRRVPDGWARISLACPDQSAEVTIDGAPAGLASDYAANNGRLLVRPGWHRIELRSRAGQRAVREAHLGPGDDVAFAVLLPANGGS